MGKYKEFEEFSEINLVARIHNYEKLINHPNLRIVNRRKVENCADN